MQPAPEPLVVSIRPDLWQRRQVARWFLAAFEIGFAVGLAGLVGSFVGGLLGGAAGAALGNDALGILIPSAFWSVMGGILAAYGMLRLLAWL